MKKLFILIMLLNNLSIAANFDSSDNQVFLTSEEISKSVEKLLDLGKLREAKDYLNIILDNQRHNGSEDHPDYIKISSLLANVYFCMGDYLQALKLYNSYFEFGAKVLANDSSQVVILNNITRLMVALGRYDDALSYCEQAKKINKSHDELHPDKLRTLSNEATIYLEKGKYEQAQKLFEHVLGAQLKILGSTHPDYISTLVGLTNTYACLGMHDKSKEFLERWLAQNADTVDSAILGSIYDSLGTSKFGLAKYSESLEHFQRAQAIKIKFLGETHPDSVMTKHNIALVYQGLDRFIEAKELLKGVHIWQLKVLGEMHPDYIKTLHNLANICKIMGNYEESQKYFDETLKWAEKVFYDHSFLAVIYNNRGSLYKSRSVPMKALEMYKKAQELNVKLLGSAHPDTLRIMNNIASVYTSLGQFDKALAEHKTALELKKQVFGLQHQSVGITLSNIGVIHTALGNFEEALKYFQEHQKIIVALLGEESSECINLLQNIGEIYKSQKRHDDAVKNYEKALGLSIKIFGEEHHRTGASFNNISVVYFLLGQHEKALEYAEKGLKIRNHCFSSAKIQVSFMHNGRKITLTEAKHADVATSYHTLGYLWHQIAQTITGREKPEHLAKAEYYYRLAWEMRKALLNEAHPDISTTMNNLALVCKLQGKFQEALEVNLKALDYTIKIFGKDHLNTAISYNNLGSIYASMERFNDALYIFNDAYRIRNIHLPSNHPEVLTVVSQMAEIYQKQALTYHRQNNTKKGLELLSAQLQLMIDLNGDDHLSVALMHYWFASFCDSIKWYNGALKHYLRSVEIREKSLEPNRSDLIATLINLGVSYHNNEEYLNAIKTFFNALEIAIDYHGKDHKRVSDILCHIAISYRAMNQITMAIQHFEWSLDILRPIKDPECANILEAIGDLYSKLAQYPVAKKYDEEAAKLSPNPQEKKEELRKRLLSKIESSYGPFGLRSYFPSLPERDIRYPAGP